MLCFTPFSDTISTHEKKKKQTKKQKQNEKQEETTVLQKFHHGAQND